jgi:hypothetical protein
MTTDTPISRQREASLLAAYARLAVPVHGIGTEDEVRTALSVLLRLSEQADSGELRDQIAAVRHELHDSLGE